MDWGLLQGLGQGLQQLGGWKMEQDAEKRRSLLAEKLQKEREERAEGLRLSRPDPDRTTYEKGEGGVTWRVVRNADGTELDRVLASQTEIDRIKKDTEKEDLTIESLRSQIDASKATTEAKRKDTVWAEEDRALLTPEQRRQAALVDSKLAPSADTKYSTDGSIQRTLLSGSAKSGGDDEDAPTMADYADDYLDQNPGVAAKYIDTKLLTENQAKDAVIQVLREFAKRGVKPTQTDFDNALQAYAKRVPKDSTEKKPGGIKMTLSG